MAESKVLVTAAEQPRRGKRDRANTYFDMEDEIDHDLELLEQTTVRSMSSEDLDFVNLDQLGNTIGGSQANKNRKYAIFEVLNQEIKHPQALRCIDQCIELILNQWKVKELKNKKKEDLFELLQHKEYKMTIWQDLISYFYDPPSLICSKIIIIAKRIVNYSHSMKHVQTSHN